MQAKISIIGAGNVGGQAAHLILQRQLADVVLLDIVEGLAIGKTLDLEQSGFIEGYKKKITGTADYRDIKGSQIVLITAGLTRRPGMDRLGLLKKNAVIIGDIVKHIVEYCPDSIILMMTNPVDVLAYYAWQNSGFPENRVLGQAGVLDTARFRYFLSQETGYLKETMVLGGHGDTMLPVLRKPLTDSIPKVKINSVIDKTRNGGGQIVSLLKTSAYYAPAAAAVSMIEAILGDTKKIMPVSARLNGEYGISDVYIGVPAVLGKNGVEKIIELELTQEEKSILQNSAELYKKSISEL